MNIEMLYTPRQCACNSRQKNVVQERFLSRKGEILVLEAFFLQFFKILSSDE